MGSILRHYRIGVLTAACVLTVQPACAREVDFDAGGYDAPASLPATTIQCVPYARETSGIRIFGDAAGWWDLAEGRYARGAVPRVGAVLAFRASGSMPSGHVATVSRILSSRDILIDHANWSAPNMIEHDVLARDVSPDNDWSDVRVWYSPGGALGTRVNPAYGFIYPDGAAPRSVTPPVRPPIRYAAAERTSAPVPAARTNRAVRPAAQTRDPFIIEYADDAPVNLLPRGFSRR